MSGIKHPARHYLYYLLSKRIYDAAHVIEQMQAIGLPTPTYDYEFEPLVLDIVRTKALMKFPVPFNPKAVAPTTETSVFLREWKLSDIWTGSPYVATATEILSEPNVRHLLELLLLGPLSAQAIATRVAARFGLPSHAMNSAVVRAYAHYFWDVNALDPGQWHAFIDLYYKRVATDYLAALQAPRSQAGAAFTIAVADKDPQLLGAADRYETASSLAFRMLMHHALPDKPSTGAVYAAFTALNMMRMADEELGKHKGASTDLIDELRRLKPTYDQASPLKITDAPFIQRPVLDVKATEVKDAGDD